MNVWINTSLIQQQFDRRLIDQWICLFLFWIQQLCIDLNLQYITLAKNPVIKDIRKRNKISHSTTQKAYLLVLFSFLLLGFLLLRRSSRQTLYWVIIIIFRSCFCSGRFDGVYDIFIWISGKIIAYEHLNAIQNLKLKLTTTRLIVDLWAEYQWSHLYSKQGQGKAARMTKYCPISLASWGMALFTTEDISFIFNSSKEKKDVTIGLTLETNKLHHWTAPRPTC